jgi:hypothetical protein
MTDEQRARYVAAALMANGYTLDAAHEAVIVEQFSRIEAIARSFVDDVLPVDAEPAVVFRP